MRYLTITCFDVINLDKYLGRGSSMRRQEALEIHPSNFAIISVLDTQDKISCFFLIRIVVLASDEDRKKMNGYAVGLCISCSLPRIANFP